MKISARNTVACLAATMIITIAPVAYGAASDKCIEGYVWREAFPGDHVCVTPQTRSEAAKDNKLAKTRVQKGGGAYGPDTCIQGYVWREARKEDHVCVSPQTRAQAAQDNQAAASRVVRTAVAVVSPKEAKDNKPHLARAAQVQNIACPVNEVRAEVTTALPEPWWQTPQVGGLATSTIQNIGGKETLVCRYKVYGTQVSVMREMPEGASQCTPTRGGFSCR